MTRWIKTLVAPVIIFFLVCTPATAASVYSSKNSEPTFSGMVVDLVMVRPLGLTATLLGCLFFTASLPFTVWSKERIGTAGRNYVVNPSVFTFVRPLGERLY